MNAYRSSPMLDKLAGQTAPRYTSYPTTPHFSAAVGADNYRSWLAALPAGAALSLYLHVPFCEQLCLYCGCHTKAVRRREPIEAYADRLVEEIALVAAQAGHRQVVQIHWGGGTPSILGSDGLQAVVETLGEAFDLSALREHAIELDPRHVTGELVRALAGIGIDRASLGVQDFSAHVQAAIGRVQPFETVQHAADLLREAGIDRINIDLMYGLPGQTLQDVKQSAALAHAIEPRRLAVFGYAHVPWFKPHQRLINTAALPGPGERLQQAQAIHDTLTSLGYHAIGLDHYARPDDVMASAAHAGKLHRNFQGYTVDEADALIGLGASAIGRLPQGFVQNAPDIGGYSRAIAAARLATVKGYELSADDRMRGSIIERLMCDLAVDLDDLCGGTVGRPRERFQPEFEALKPFAADGLLRIEGNRISVSERGRPFLRLVAASFDAHLQANRARHSVSV